MMKEVQRSSCMMIRPQDSTACAIRNEERDQTNQELFGFEKVFKAVYDVLVASRHEREGFSEEYHTLLPQSQIVLLYGRKGSGKNTMLHSKQRILFTSFECVADWKLRTWNMREFSVWCQQRIDQLLQIQRFHQERRDAVKVTWEHGGEAYERKLKVLNSQQQQPSSILILIENLHLFHYGQTGSDVAVDMFTRLLYTVRSMHNERNVIRVMLTCDESPGTFPSEMIALFDVKYIMPLPGQIHRVQIALSLMNRFFKLREQYPGELGTIEWDVDIDFESVANDPNHVLSTFVVRSVGTTPREIYDYMIRTFNVCAHPEKEGATRDYGPALFEALKYDIDGLTCITPYNPMKKNESTFAYAQLNQEEVAQIGTCVVTADTGDVQMNDVDRSAAKADAEGEDDKKEDGEDGAKKKKRKVALVSQEPQPASMLVAINARVEQQEKDLKKAYKDADFKQRQEEKRNRQ